jgi:uncharacterized protein (TIGR00369 family)
MTNDRGFHALIGLRRRAGDDGRAEVTLDATDDHLNPGGTVHGGAIAALVDSAMGLAVDTVTGDERRPVTVEMKVTYLEPGAKGPLTAIGQVRKAGKRLIVAEAEVVQGDEVIALASGTYTTVG